MKRRRLGRTGLVVSEICLGTMTFGNQADERASRAILDRAYDAGIDFLDVAEVYPVPPDFKYAGRSEEIVGRWLAEKPRDAVIIATKVAGPGRALPVGVSARPVRHRRYRRRGRAATDTSVLLEASDEARPSHTALTEFL
jgi:aryl-alcohol dehydrogenase-like predicted oxidoreductase